MRTVFAIGTEVDLGNKLVGKVLEVCLKSGSEQYLVVWWDGRTRKTEWLNAEEVLPKKDSKTMPVGFCDSISLVQRKVTTTPSTTKVTRGTYF